MSGLAYPIPDTSLRVSRVCRQSTAIMIFVLVSTNSIISHSGIEKLLNAAKTIEKNSIGARGPSIITGASLVF